MTTSHRGLAAFTGINAVAAWAGAAGLVTGYLALGDKLNDRLPFESPVFGGIALALVVAIPLSVVTRLAWNGRVVTAKASTLCGFLLIGWIAAQLVIVRDFSYLQPFYVGVGLALVTWGHLHRTSSPNDRSGQFPRLQAALERTSETINPLVTPPKRRY